MSSQVSGFKRAAEFQLTKESDQLNDDPHTSFNSSHTVISSESSENGQVIENSMDDIESRRKVAVKDASITPASSDSSAGSGFLAYSKTNPFAAAFSTSSGFGTTTSASSTTTNSNGFGFSSFSSATTKTFGLASALNQKGLKVVTKPNELHVSPVLTPSPRTEKINPFSSVSPKLNPFMKIGVNKEEPFLERSTSQSSQSSTTSQSSKPYTAPPAKSFFTAFKDNNKLSVNTSVKTSPASISLPSTSSVGDRGRDDLLLQSRSIDSVGDIEDVNAANEEPEAEDKDDGGKDDSDKDEDVLAKDDEHLQQTYSKIYHLPENVVVLTGEENEDCIIQHRAKLYRWIPKVPSTSFTATEANDSSNTNLHHDTDASASKPANPAMDATLDGSWVEVGVGPVRYLQEKIGTLVQTSTTSSESSTTSFRKARIVMRREEKKGGHGTKLLLNVPLQGYISCMRQGDKAVRITCVHPEMEDKPPTPQMYVLKTKSATEAEDALQTIQTCVEEAEAAGY